MTFHTRALSLSLSRLPLLTLSSVDHGRLLGGAEVFSLSSHFQKEMIIPFYLLLPELFIDTCDDDFIFYFFPFHSRFTFPLISQSLLVFPFFFLLLSCFLELPILLSCNSLHIGLTERGYGINQSLACAPSHHPQPLVTASVGNFPGWDHSGALAASTGKLLGHSCPP